MPVLCLGLAQQSLALVCGLGLGAPVGVLSIGPLGPRTCARAVVAILAVRLVGEQLEVNPRLSKKHPSQGSEDQQIRRAEDRKPASPARSCWGGLRSPARFRARQDLAPGKILPRCHRFGTATSLTFWVLLWMHGEAPVEESLSGADGMAPFSIPKKVRTPKRTPHSALNAFVLGRQGLGMGTL
jgi:hypothetical protein